MGKLEFEKRGKKNVEINVLFDIVNALNFLKRYGVFWRMSLISQYLNLLR